MSDFTPNVDLRTQLHLEGQFVDALEGLASPRPAGARSPALDGYTQVKNVWIDLGQERRVYSEVSHANHVAVM